MNQLHLPRRTTVAACTTLVLALGASMGVGASAASAETTSHTAFVHSVAARPDWCAPGSGSWIIHCGPNQH